MKTIIRLIRSAGNVLFSTLLIAITFIYAMFQGGFVSWFLFYSFLPFGLYSLLLSIYPLTISAVQRSINKSEYTTGERLVGVITIDRKVAFPLFYLVVEEVLPPEFIGFKQQGKSKIVLFPWFKTRLRFEYEIPAIPRGEYFFSKIRLRTGDLFGLVEKEEVYTIPHRVLVYPKYYKMTYKSLESRFEQGMSSSHVNIQRDTTIAVGIREYKPGDRFSWIDWKSSARKNDIMTKEFEQQQSQDIMVFLDRTKSDQFEQVITFTASLLRAIIKKGAQVSLVSIGKERSVYPLRSGDAQLQQLYFHLAKVKANSIEPFSQTITTEIQKNNQPATYVFVTSSLDSELVQVIERLSVRHTGIAVFIPKELPNTLTELELRLIGKLRQRNILVKDVCAGQYNEAFLGVKSS